MTTTLTQAQAETMSVRIWDWLDTLNERSTNMTFDTQPGKRYVKVVAIYGGTTAAMAARHVHAFYEPATGNVYKAAGWRAPAKGVRYNLLDDASYARMIEVADPYGSYLYLR
jgi:hypothetical protein